MAQHRNTVILAGLSVVLAYLIALVTPLDQRTDFWLRGAHYFAYQAVFLPLLFVLLVIRLRRDHNTRRRTFASVLYGALAGYAAGLVATLVFPLFLEHDVAQFAQSLKLTTRAAWIAFFWFPVRLQSWLVGAISAVMLILIGRYGRQDNVA
jgi:hypothetical protein